MNDFLFVSGWAGFPQLFPDLFTERPPGAPGRCRFVLPFVHRVGGSAADLSAAPTDEAAVLATILTAPEPVLAAWSTGAHMVLRRAADILPRFERVVLFAPFLRFTDHVAPRVLRLMQRGFRNDPAKVVADFHVACDAPPAVFDAASLLPALAGDLARGLEYLGESVADFEPLDAPHVIIVHGAADAIVPPAASRKVAERLRGARLVETPGGHAPSGRDVLENLAGEGRFAAEA